MRDMFKQSLPVLARMMTAQYGLSVRFGSNPKTDGQTICLPHLPLDADEDTRLIFEGHLDHEAAHCLFSDFSVMSGGRVKDRLFYGLLHGVEDPRIERAMAERYPGCRYNLIKSDEFSLERGEVKDGVSGSPGEILSCYVLFHGFVKRMGKDFMAPLRDRSRAALAQYLGEDGLDRLDALLDAEVPTLRSTQDAFLLTEKILELVREIADQQSQEGGEPGSSGSGDGEESSQSDSEEDGSSGSSADEDGDQGSSSSGDGDESSQSSSDGDDGGSESSGGDDSDARAPAQEILNDSSEGASSSPIDKAKTLEVVIEEVQDSQQGPPGSGAGSGALQIGSVAAMPESDPEAYISLREELSSSVRMVQRELELIMGLLKRPSRLTARKGRVNSKKVARLYKGDPRVFRKKRYEEVPESAVELLIDLSGSMNGIHAEWATKAAIAVAEACERVDTSVEVATMHMDHFGVAKPFGTSCRGSRSALAGMARSASGSTPLDGAMFEAALRLVGRSEPRKIFFVVTDGMPNNGPVASADLARRIESVADVVGIGIGHTSVQQIFSESVVLEDISELGSTLVEAVSKRLTRRVA